jgi:hypothetical protein
MCVRARVLQNSNFDSRRVSALYHMMAAYNRYALSTGVHSLRICSGIRALDHDV